MAVLVGHARLMPPRAPVTRTAVRTAAAVRQILTRRPFLLRCLARGSSLVAGTQLPLTRRSAGRPAPRTALVAGLAAVATGFAAVPLACAALALALPKAAVRKGGRGGGGGVDVGASPTRSGGRTP
ncbi:hypothetical protein [Streptomyces sp. NBC_01013]|uniref:hypothetical protein n=1 Tax=Streptomyces sp. NBC_01013 TaxID=2903718 RepID=UPI003864633E